MSYCRSSSDNWKSDVYCYGSGDGYITHVSNCRLSTPAPELPELDDDEEEDDAYWTLFNKQIQHVNTVEKVEIGLPHDDATFCDKTLTGFRSTLRYLRQLGYRIPQQAFDRIERELAEGRE